MFLFLGFDALALIFVFLYWVNAFYSSFKFVEGYSMSFYSYYFAAAACGLCIEVRIILVLFLKLYWRKVVLNLGDITSLILTSFLFKFSFLNGTASSPLGPLVGGGSGYVSLRSYFILDLVFFDLLADCFPLLFAGRHKLAVEGKLMVFLEF